MERSVGGRNRLLKRVRATMLWVGCTALAAIAAGVLYLFGALYSNRPLLSGHLPAAGLDAAVTIDRDTNGLALITATGPKDLAYALGFVHAQERFFQMDIMRRTAAGELAALLGHRSLEADRRVRLYQFRHVAERVVQSLSDEERALLESYAQGVNRGLAAAGRPFEHALLRVQPEAWRSEDTILVQMSMYLLLQPDQNRNHPELVRRRLQHIFAPDVVELLLARGAEWDAPLDGQSAATATAAAATVPDSLRFDGVVPRVSGHDAVAGEASLAVGSNSWAVSGERTPDHRAILANDMHLPLQMPNMLFRVALKLTAWDSVSCGVTIPGTPLLLAGSNGHIAWGVTNSDGDWSDVVLLERHDWNQLHTVHETIQVKGGASVDLAVETSPFGPIIDKDDHYAYALEWVPLHVEGSNLAFNGMLTARTLQEAVGIAAASGIPELNLLVVDDQGNALWTIAGRIPRRNGFGGEEAVAWNDTVGWQGWLDRGEYPVRSSQDHPYLWTANNRVVSGPDLEKIGRGSRFALGVRAQRIRADLEKSPLTDEASLYRMQFDITSPLMDRWHQLTLQVVSTIDDAAAREELHSVLSHWDGRAAQDSAAYRIVRRYRDAITDAVMPQVLTKLIAGLPPGTEWSQELPDFETPLWRIVAAQPANAVPAKFGSWREFLRRTLVREVYQPYKQRYGDLRRAVWGDANRSSIAHPLSPALPLVGRWLLDMPSSPMSGDSNVIDAQLGKFGPAVRLVVSPGHEADAIMTMPGGQAGNPLTPYYGAGHGQWMHGERMPLLPGAIKYSLRLLPESRTAS